MPGKISKEDIEDLDFLDRDELRSDGTLVFKSGVSVTSTTSSTKRVVISGFDLLLERDTPVEAGDKVTFSGTLGGAADGTFTVASIIDGSTFDVVEAIADSTGGSASFKYSSGASQIGFDPTGATGTSATTLQQALKEVSNNASGISAGVHQTLRQLIHLAEEGGPFEGFASGAYQETLPAADPFPTSIIWWESAAKLKKIVEETVTYNANKTIATDEWKVYDTDGSTVLATVTDTINYSGIFETSRTRAIA